MNREIKFRAFSGISMVEADEFTIDGDTGAVRLTSYSSYGDPTELMDSWTLMQYTGLKDKNGVEIYEGDILETFVNDSPIKGAMEWNESAAMWSSFRPLSGFEVIGNIHENPELLKP